MTFPTIAPTARAYSAGNWPVRSYNAVNGYEFRIIYGDKRFGHKLELTYANIPDATAEQFINHYKEQKGTYKTFELPTASGGEITPAQGWNGSPDFYDAGDQAMYRYEGPPQLNSVSPGVSTLVLGLVSVVVD